jgi:Arc/MetJ family transcription regulator
VTLALEVSAFSHMMMCYNVCNPEVRMATNLALDDDLISQAQKVGHHKTKKDAVTAALKEYIAHKKQAEILELFGKVDFDKGYDYKKARMR